MVSAKAVFALFLWILDWTFLSRYVGAFDISTTCIRTKPSSLNARKSRSSNAARLNLSGDSNSVATRPQSDNTKIDENLLRQLDGCTTGTSAFRLLEKALLGQADETAKKPLFGSIQITPGISDKTISDGDLAIQTKVRNKKYGIFDLIDTNGDRDADRIAAAVFGVFVGSSLSAIAVNENLPGPEILRFTIVWLLSFAPL